MTPIDWSKSKQNTAYCITCKGTADVMIPIYRQCGVTYTKEPSPTDEIMVLCPGGIPNKAKRVSSNKVEHIN